MLTIECHRFVVLANLMNWLCANWMVWQNRTVANLLTQNQIGMRNITIDLFGDPPLPPGWIISYHMTHSILSKPFSSWELSLKFAAKNPSMPVVPASSQNVPGASFKTRGRLHQLNCSGRQVCWRDEPGKGPWVWLGAWSYHPEHSFWNPDSKTKPGFHSSQMSEEVICLSMETNLLHHRIRNNGSAVPSSVFSVLALWPRLV